MPLSSHWKLGNWYMIEYDGKKKTVTLCQKGKSGNYIINIPPLVIELMACEYARGRADVHEQVRIALLGE